MRFELRLLAIAGVKDKAPRRNGRECERGNEQKRMATASLDPSFGLSRSLSVLILSPHSLLTLAGKRAPLEHGHGPAAKGPPPKRRVQPDRGVEHVRRGERRERGRVGRGAEGEPACGEGPHC